MKFFKKSFFTFILLLCVVLTGFSASFNYGEALQKSIFFYEAQQAGPLPSWNRVEWRGDSTMNDAVLGGLYDAGDHVKFNLPMAYTASTLGWAVYEYRSAFEASGQMQHIENNITFILDYLMACSSGTYVYQVGDGTNDHSWWGPVEVLHLEPMAGDRPSFSSSSGISCVMAQSAAALAIGAKLFGNSSYLSRAQSLYSSALSSKSDAVYEGGAAANFYNSWSGPIDELLWAAIWLHIATGNTSYLSDAESLVLELNKQPNTDEDVIEYRWGHCWDDVHYGAMILLSRLTNNRDYMDYVEMHLDWWTVGYNGEKITTSPGGLAVCDSWGTLRHATTTALIAFIYADWVSDATLKDRYQSFAEHQINYALGDNPRNSSYMIGFGNNPPQHPHHRTAHGSWLDSMNNPPNHRHTIYGALVGGADSSDGYKDEISDYVMNEIACDYNAGLVGGLAKMYDMYGGSPLSNFPPSEEKEDEFFMVSELTSTGTNSIAMKLDANNRSAWPARTAPNLKFRYFMDLSELFAAGGSTSSISSVSYYSEFSNTISAPIQFSGDIYYIEIVFDNGNDVYPGGNSEHAAEVQLNIQGPSGGFDNSNDPSFQGFGGVDDKNSAIVMYDGDTIIWGQEPGAPDPTTPPASTAAPTTAPTTVPTTAPTTAPNPTTAPGILKGDTNSDGSIDIVDALLVAQFYVGLATSIDEEAADVNCDSTIDIVDALRIAQYYVELISEFDC